MKIIRYYNDIVCVSTENLFLSSKLQKVQRIVVHIHFLRGSMPLSDESTVFSGNFKSRPLTVIGWNCEHLFWFDLFLKRAIITVS